MEVGERWCGVIRLGLELLWYIVDISSSYIILDSVVVDEGGNLPSGIPSGLEKGLIGSRGAKVLNR
jgi:hypothetical protein